MKYRKKPVVIEAFQFHNIYQKNLPVWAIDGIMDGFISSDEKYPDKCCIRTIEGDMRATSGDYIIKGVKGEFYPCRKDIFESTYEPVCEVKQ